VGPRSSNSNLQGHRHGQLPSRGRYPFRPAALFDGCVCLGYGNSNPGLIIGADGVAHTGTVFKGKFLNCNPSINFLHDNGLTVIIAAAYQSDGASCFAGTPASNDFIAVDGSPDSKSTLPRGLAWGNN